ncbi:hypothetical protein RRF57_007998 [Xylaria bambusicola]|uniref:Uncharacterized protein n=1 Tax=Xylaria bambusicola TaxID=326684 RepID=A0AAN7V178_9PEZI
MSATYEARELHGGSMGLSLSLHSHTAAFRVHVSTEQVLGPAGTPQVPGILPRLSPASSTFAVNGPWGDTSSPPMPQIIPVWESLLGNAKGKDEVERLPWRHVL